MTNISICIPSIRVENLPKILKQIKESIGKYSYEVIVVSPEPQKQSLNVKKWIQTFRNPTACIQQAAIQACGELFTWLPDDGNIIEDSLELAINSFFDEQNYKTQVIIPYYEGDNVNRGSILTQPVSYWTAYYHPSLALVGVPPFYKTAPVGLLDTKYFVELGGFDCNFWHANMSCHDLSFRIQNDSGKLVLPPKYVMNCEFSHNIINGRCDCILCKIYVEHDLPYFQSIYSNLEAINRVKIPLDNWFETPEKWERFTRV